MEETKATSMPAYKIRIRFSFARITGILMLVIGIITLTASTMTNSTISAMIGLGLVFWGIILLCVQTEEYVKARAFDATMLSASPALEQALKELGYEGKASYLPPRYFNESEIVKVFVPKRRAATLLTPEQTQELQKPRRQTSPGILLTPPGSELTKLFETTLGRSFAETNLAQLQEEMPKLLVEELEIASDFEMTTEASAPTGSTADSATKAGGEPAVVQIKLERIRRPIRVKVVTSTHKGTNKEAAKLRTNSFSIGSPLTSAIACAIAKATGKPITIENEEISTDGKTLEAKFRIHE